MNNTQRAKLEACNRVAAFNTNRAAKLSTIDEYAHEQTKFETALTIINNAAQVQASGGGTTASEVDKAKLAMATVVNKYALRALVKAKQLNNKALANLFDHPITYISKASKDLSAQRAKDIAKQLDDNKALLTNITPAFIKDITNSIAAYEKIKDSPIIDIQHKTANGTNPLTEALDDAFEAIDSMYDLVVSYFADEDKTMVDELALAKQLIITGTRHNGVEGTVSKEGHGVANITLKIDGTTKTATTDADGHYAIIKIKTGNYNISISGTGITAKSQSIKITKGVIETLDFHI